MKPREWTPPSQTRRIIPYLFGAAVILALGTLAVGRLRAETAALEQERRRREAESARGTRVLVAPVAQAPQSDSIRVTCDVKPYRRVQLFPRITGFLRSLAVEKGQPVRAGQVLAVLEARDSEELLRGARLDLRSKSRQLSRSLTLGRSLVSPQELDRVETEVALASAEVARLEALNAYQVLRAPFDGIVVARHADPGALVVVPSAMSGPMPILEIWDTSRLRVEGRLSQTDAASVRPGDPAVIWTDERPTETIDATIARTTGAIDPRTRTMPFEIELGGCPCGLLPGSFARVQLNIPAPSALSIPVDALTTRRGQPVVVVVRDGRGTFREVKLGRTDGRTARVLSGLEAGELVALFPSDALTDRAALRPVPAEEPGPK